MRRVSIALLCLWVSAAAAADGELQCGRLSTRITERVADEKNGEVLTHQTEVSLGNVPLVTFPSWGPPQVGCLRKSALMVAGGDPVEGRSVVMVFPDGRHIGLWWDAPVEFHDGEATLREPVSLALYSAELRAQIPSEFRDLFLFPDAPK
jgi:hypothetical protein